MAAIEQVTIAETINPGVKKTTPSPKSKKNADVGSSPSSGEAEKNVVVRGWKKIKGQADQDLLLFKITQEVTLKIEWTALPENIQTAFTDVLTTVKKKGEVYDSETDGECFVFGFTDETVNLSAVCTTLNGKVAFFYKEEALNEVIR